MYQMRIYVKTTTGKVIPFEVNPNDLIKNIKANIQAKEGISREHQILTYLDQKLEDEKAIKQYAIPIDAILVMSIEPKKDSISIIIQMNEGINLNLKVETASQVIDLKRMIETKANVPSNRQRLYYNGQELIDFIKIDEYSIKNDSQIKLIIESSEIINIFINDLSEKLIPLEIKQTDTIQTIKMMIKEKNQLEINQQRLFYNQKELENSYTIQNYSISKNSILTVIPHTKSGIKININTTSKKSFSINVEPNEKISYIKEKIQFLEGFFIYQQRLTYAGILLDDECTLEDYLIPKNANLEMALFIKGGKLIFIKMNKGKYIPFEVEQNETILSLKKEIQKNFDISFDQINLTFNDQQLEDGKTFQHYSIPKESIISMSLKIPENMFVCIKIFKGEKVIIDVQPNDPIQKVKEKIKELLNIPVDQQRLIFDGEQLDDDKSLFEYSITNGSQILLIQLIKHFFQIFLKSPKTNQQFSIDVEQTNMIKDIKLKINEKEGFETEKIKLFIDDRQLDDNKSLESLSIEKDSKLNMVVLSRDGIIIFIKMENKKFVPLEVLQTDTIGDVKKQIFEKEGFQPDQFELCIYNKQLENDKKIQDYEIENGQMIFFARKLKGSLKIFVKFNEERIPIDVELSFLIEEVKNQIMYIRGIPIENQKLIFNGTVLENGKKLQDYSVECCSVLILIIKS